MATEVAALRECVTNLEATLTQLASVIQVDASGNVLIQSTHDVTINALNKTKITGNTGMDLLSDGTSIRLNPTGIALNTPSTVTINASLMNFSAGLLTVNSGHSKFSSVLQSDTLITNNVIASSYTPGAGNIW